MGNQTLYSAQGLTEGAHTHFAQHLFGVVERPSLEGDHRPETLHLPLSKFVLRMIAKTRIENCLDLFVLAPKIRHGTPVLLLLDHPHGNTLRAPHHPPRFEPR